MSGHSKWHNIQKTKGAADAKRSAAFTKIAKEIIVAVKQGGSGDSNNNSRLATVVAKAKADTPNPSRQLRPSRKGEYQDRYRPRCHRDRKTKICSFENLRFALPDCGDRLSGIHCKIEPRHKVGAVRQCRQPRKNVQMLFVVG